MSNRKNDALMKPPERWPVLIFGDGVLFPGDRLATKLGDEIRTRIMEHGQVVVASVFPEEERAEQLPPIGVLAVCAENTDVAAAGFVSLLLISRVRIIDPRPMFESPSGTAFDCRIEHIASETISEEAWHAAQENVAAFQRTFIRFGLSTHVLLRKVFKDVAVLPNKEEKEAKGQLMLQVSEKFSSVMARVEVVDRERIHDAPNAVGSFAAQLLHCLAVMGCLSEGTSRKYSRVLRGALFERNTLVQLATLTRFMNEFAGEMTLLARGKKQAKRKDGAPGGDGHPDDASLPEEIQKIIKDCLPQAQSGTADGNIHRAYIDWLRKVPYRKKTKDNRDPAAVRRVLDEDHYGLDKVKDTILDFLAVRRVKPDAKGQILCFVGPAGVGKTSICQSIARGMERKYVRISLGGMHEEAEIRGHRRTFIGSLPGQIIQGLVRADSMNPVFVFDEIDKIGLDDRGRVDFALMEVLDPEQNKTFKDHYLDVPVDLSEVFFIMTANVTDTIPEPLLNRMEVIELPGYTDDEKVRIAKAHIVRKANRECGIDLEHPENMRNEGLPVIDVRYTDPALSAIASDYTEDAGMRQMSQAIAKIARRTVRTLQEGGIEAVDRGNGNGNGDGNGNGNGGRAPGTPPEDVHIVTITPRKLKKLLGQPNPKTPLQDVLNNPPPGVAPILMVRADGQGVLGCVEVSFDRRPTPQLHCTGLMEQVIKESVHVAFSRLFHAHGPLAKWPHNLFVHVHCDENAIPKDGPSAGVLICAAICSAVTRVPLKRLFSITGEIPLIRAADLPVGGVKSKLLAALKGGIREVAIPLETLDQLDDFPRENVRRIVTPSNLPKGQSWCDVSRGEREPGTLTIYCVEKPEDAFEMIFPNWPPPAVPPKEWLDQFAAMPEID